MFLEFCLAASIAVPATCRAADIFDQNRALGRGVNIIGYDPLWRSREIARFQDKHFRLLKEAGFNSVRINLHPFRQMSSAKAPQIPEAWFAIVDWALTNARAQGLTAILDFHEFTAMGDRPEANRDKFLAFWRQASERYKDAPRSVFFEVLNEPNKNLTPMLWNSYLREALEIIRRTNPDRPVV
ncbi:MAG TPA: cellulase family glycosylhydrolase, partial [Candidatus Acidoferrum sp.]